MFKKIKRLTLTTGLISLILLPIVAQANGLPNPIGDQDMTIADLIIRLIQGFLGFIAFMAFFMFVVGGFQMITAAGIPDRIQKAKDTILWAVIGLIVVATAWQMVKFLLEAIKGTLV